MSGALRERDRGRRNTYRRVARLRDGERATLESTSLLLSLLRNWRKNRSHHDAFTWDLDELVLHLEDLERRLIGGEL